MDYEYLWKTLMWRINQELRNERYTGADPVGLIELQKVLNWMEQLEDKPDQLPLTNLSGLSREAQRKS